MAPDIPEILNYKVYNATTGQLFEGMGNSYQYFIATSSGVNSKTDPSVPGVGSTTRYLIKIDGTTTNNGAGTPGTVLDISTTTCSGGGGIGGGGGI